MRHIWNTSDGVIAAVVQKGGYEGDGLVLYKSLDDGLNWEVQTISDDIRIVSDGVIDKDNNILLVTSLITDRLILDVNFIKMTYHSGSKVWSQAKEVTVFNSNGQTNASRASISIDSNDVIWCAFRIQDVTNNEFQIKVRYSEDGGVRWNDIENGLFGTANDLAEKTAKVIAVGNRMAMIYQDVRGSASVTDRFKEWAYREETWGLDAAWITEPIVQIMALEGDPYSSHWSVAADDLGNIHLSYQDNGIKYLKYDAAKGIWNRPIVAARFGNFNNISVAANNDLYLFSKSWTGRKIICKRFSHADQRWSRWINISSRDYNGFLRMSSPERCVDRLPLIYEIRYSPPYQLLYCLFQPLP
jgi:hypothetical protein